MAGLGMHDLLLDLVERLGFLVRGWTTFCKSPPGQCREESMELGFFGKPGNVACVRRMVFAANGVSEKDYMQDVEPCFIFYRLLLLPQWKACACALV